MLETYDGTTAVELTMLELYQAGVDGVEGCPERYGVGVGEGPPGPSQLIQPDGVPRLI